MGYDAAGSAVRLAEFLEGDAKRRGEAVVCEVGCELFAGASGPKLVDERLVNAKVTLVDEGAYFGCDREHEARAVLCGEAQFAGLRVVVRWAESGRCARADGKVRTQENPEPQMRRRAGH
jgi:hypothetical protein